MTDKKQITLRKMKDGQSGIVSQIQGGHGLISRLSAMGIRPGQKITRVGSSLMRGPVARVAIGFGMANKIIAELV